MQNYYYPLLNTDLCTCSTSRMRSYQLYNTARSLLKINTDGVTWRYSILFYNNKKKNAFYILNKITETIFQITKLPKIMLKSKNKLNDLSLCYLRYFFFSRSNSICNVNRILRTDGDVIPRYHMMTSKKGFVFNWCHLCFS